jgi:hypothetical protein
VASVTWTHGGSPADTQNASLFIGVSGTGSADFAAPVAAWAATDNENGSTGTVNVTSDGGSANFASVSILVQLFDDGSINPATTLNTLSITFDWAITNGPMSTATAKSAINSSIDGSDDFQGPGTSTGTYTRTDTGANVGVPTWGDLYTAVGVGTGGAVGFTWNPFYDAGTFSAHPRALTVSNFSMTGTTPPSVDSLTPITGTVVGGTLVTISGGGFTGITSVEFDGVAATEVNVVNDTTVTCRTPAHAAGLVDVEVLTVGTLVGAFTYVTVISVTPNRGSILGGTPVTIKGGGFTAATGVEFDGVAATDVVIVSDTRITAVTPGHAAGLVDVEVLSVGTGVGLYTYVARGPVKLPPVPVTAPVAQTDTPTFGGGAGPKQGANSGGRGAAPPGQPPMQLEQMRWLMAVKKAIEDQSN